MRTCTTRQSTGGRHVATYQLILCQKRLQRPSVAFSVSRRIIICF